MLEGEESKLIFFFKIFIWLYQFLVVACGIQFPTQGSNQHLLHWGGRVLATQPPGKSQIQVLFSLRPLRSPSLMQESSRQSHWNSSLEFGSKSLVRNGAPCLVSSYNYIFSGNLTREGWLIEDSIQASGTQAVNLSQRNRLWYPISVPRIIETRQFAENPYR